MKKNNKAFTLLELISVLIILSIIVLIVTPLVLNIVRKAKDSANKRSVDAYGKAIELSIATQMLDTGETIKNGRYHSKQKDNGNKIYDNSESAVLDVNYSGNNVYCNIIDKNNDATVYLEDCYVNGVSVDSTYGVQVVNTLMSTDVDFSETISGGGVVSSAYNTFLSTNVDRTKIRSLNLVSELDVPAGASVSDCSQEQDESVLCWWTESDGLYDMTIGANGIIYAPEDSKELFAKLENENFSSLNLNNLDTSKVTNMASMFARFGSENFNELNLGNNFDTSNVTNMRLMFWSTKVSNLNLGDKFDTSNVTTMESMFTWFGNSRLADFNLGDKFNTSKVTNMYSMFSAFAYSSQYLKKLDLGNKFDTSNVTTIDHMFQSTGYNSMEELELGDKFDTSKATNMMQMFDSCGYMKLKKLDLKDKFDTSNVTEMDSMFYSTGYNSMEELNLGDKFDTSNAFIGSIFNFTGYKKLKSLNLGSKFKISDDYNWYISFYSMGHDSLEVLNLGALAFNDKMRNGIINFNGIGVNTLKKVIVANIDTKDYLLKQSDSNVPFKDKIEIVN